MYLVDAVYPEPAAARAQVGEFVGRDRVAVGVAHREPVERITRNALEHGPRIEPAEHRRMVDRRNGKVERRAPVAAVGRPNAQGVRGAGPGRLVTNLTEIHRLHNHCAARLLQRAIDPERPVAGVHISEFVGDDCVPVLVARREQRFNRDKAIVNHRLPGGRECRPVIRAELQRAQRVVGNLLVQHARRISQAEIRVAECLRVRGENLRPELVVAKAARAGVEGLDAMRRILPVEHDGGRHRPSGRVVEMREKKMPAVDDSDT